MENTSLPLKSNVDNTNAIHIWTMDLVEADATPAEEWQAALNATCNRLSTQYLNLLRSASSTTALEETGRRQDPRGEFQLLTPRPQTRVGQSTHSHLLLAALPQLEVVS